MFMFKHILIPVSRVAEVEKALELAAATLMKDSGEITLLHVIELIQDIPYEEFKSFYDGLEQQSKEDLKTAQQKYEEHGIEINTQIILGQRMKEILSYAEHERVDLIVLQSHPIDLTDPARGWGTISYRVAILARCPVMLVK
jgi:nucleotide-binding universal stress UspA family protein